MLGSSSTVARPSCWRSPELMAHLQNISESYGSGSGLRQGDTVWIVLLQTILKAFGNVSRGAKRLRYWVIQNSGVATMSRKELRRPHFTSAISVPNCWLLTILTTKSFFVSSSVNKFFNKIAKLYSQNTFSFWDLMHGTCSEHEKTNGRKQLTGADFQTKNQGGGLEKQSGDWNLPVRA